MLQAASSRSPRPRSPRTPTAPRRRIFSDAGAKGIRARRAEDVRPRCVRQPPASPFPFLVRRPWRADSAPATLGAYREQIGAVEIQAEYRFRLHEQQLLVVYAEALPDLRKLDVALSKRCLKPATSGSSALRSPRNPPAPAHPGASAIADHRRPGFFADSAVAGHQDPGRTCFDPPDDRGEPLAAAVPFRLATPPYDLHCIERKSHMSVTLNNRDRNLLDAVLALRDDPSLGHEVYSERQAKRTSILRAFVPTRNALVYSARGEPLRLAGPDPIYDVAGCSQSLTLNVQGEQLSACVTSVQAGDTTILHRGNGQTPIRETFDRDGVVLDVPVPARPEMLRALRGRSLSMHIDFEALEGDSQYEDGRSMFHATVARISGVELAKGGEGDCQVRLID